MSRAFIQKMFPNGLLNGRGGMEVNGLPAGSVPQNVTIIKQWKDHWEKKDRREFYHVTDGTHVAVLRICTAMKGYGYDEFVVIHDVAEVNTPEADELNKTAARWAEPRGGC